MIGGIVLEIIRLPDRLWVNCVEENSNDKCAIFVERNAQSEQIKVADRLWWQGPWALWTPYDQARKPNCGHKHHYSCAKAGVEYDIKIPRIGCSGVKRPARQYYYPAV